MLLSHPGCGTELLMVTPERFPFLNEAAAPKIPRDRDVTDTRQVRIVVRTATAQALRAGVRGRGCDFCPGPALRGAGAGS